MGVLSKVDETDSGVAEALWVAEGAFEDPESEGEPECEQPESTKANTPKEVLKSRLRLKIII